MPPTPRVTRSRIGVWPPPPLAVLVRVRHRWSAGGSRVSETRLPIRSQVQSRSPGQGPAAPARKYCGSW